MKKNIDLKKWILSAIKKNKPKLILSLICATTRSILLLFPAVVTRYIIDIALPNQDLTLLLYLSIATVLIPVITGAMIIADLYINKHIIKIFAKYRTTLFEDVLSQDLSYFNEFSSGDIIHRSIDETDKIANFFYFGLSNIIWINVTVIAGIILMILQEWRISLMLIATVIIRIAITEIISRSQKKVFAKREKTASDVNENIREDITNIDYIKSICAYEKELEIIEKKFDKNVSNELELNRYSILHSLSGLFIDIFINIILYLLGAIMILNGDITAGALISVISIFGWITPAINGYLGLHINLKDIGNSINRVSEIHRVSPLKELSLIPESTQITFRNVDFSYSERYILNNFSFEIKPNTTNYILGENGSGKSTVINLLLHLYEPLSGDIKIGDINVLNIDNKWFRNNVLLVSQQANILNDSIKNNILFGLEADFNEFKKVIEMVCLNHWLNALPQKEDTIVGERGSMISGGERQRLLIARALLRNPQILILDEATSEIDIVTETEIMKNIRTHYPEISLIIISQEERPLNANENRYLLIGGQIQNHGH